MLWCTCMQRYQIYLDPAAVSPFELYGKTVELDRSKMIRILVERASTAAAKLLSELNPEPTTASLKSLFGAIDLNTVRSQNFSVKNDKFYLEKSPKK